jgi:hypothetical protein
MNTTETKRREAGPGGLVDVLVELGQQRARIMEAMRAALLRGDDAEALERARELTGVPLKKKATNQEHSCE